MKLHQSATSGSGSVFSLRPTRSRYLQSTGEPRLSESFKTHQKVKRKRGRSGGGAPLVFLLDVVVGGEAGARYRNQAAQRDSTPSHLEEFGENLEEERSRGEWWRRTGTTGRKRCKRWSQRRSDTMTTDSTPFKKTPPIKTPFSTSSCGISPTMEEMYKEMRVKLSISILHHHVALTENDVI